jgi:hypothetical protein
MVAEAYHGDADLSLAIRRLSLLGKEAPAESVQNALVFAEAHYTEADIERIRSLSAALEAQTPTLEEETP